jgi:hypothetical protein
VHGLDDVLNIGVKDFEYIQDTGHTRFTGFIAQNINTILPSAVTTNGDDGVTELAPGISAWQIDYSKLTPLLTKAIQEIAHITGAFKTALIAWLGATDNGLERICLKKSNGGAVCVTGDDLQTAIPGATSFNAVPPAPVAPPASEPLLCTPPQVLNSEGTECVPTPPPAEPSI